MSKKKVDCLGPVLYNMEDKSKLGKKNEIGVYIDWRKDKLETIKSYKFSMAFENEQGYNYITEKIYQPLVVGSIPIYWGAPNIDKLFNPKCFVNIDNFNSYEEAIAEIIKIDENEEYYQTFFKEKSILFDVSEEKIIERIKKIILNNEKPIGTKYFMIHYILFYILNTKLKALIYIKNIIKKFI